MNNNSTDVSMWDESRNIFNDESSAQRTIEKAMARSELLTEEGEPLGVHYNSTVEAVSVFTRNLNEDFKNDIANGDGILITSPEAYDKHGEKIYEGLQSPFFGGDYIDDASYSNRFRCQCGKLIGRNLADNMTICPECHTIVEYNDADLKKTGWVYLYGSYVLSPIFYEKMKKFLGTSDNKSILDCIIKVSSKKIGETNTLAELELIEKLKCPFVGRGLTWLKDNIDEVLDYYGKKKSNVNKLLYDELKFSTYKMFTGALPIYSATLRAETAGEKESKLYKMKINTYFQAIIRCANTIKEQKEMPIPEGIADAMKQTIQEEIDIQLEKIQEHTGKVFEEEFNAIGNKKGIINSKIIGGRHNLTSRSIIVPGGDVLPADEVILPYITFLALFKFEIINMYIELFGTPMMTAVNTIEMAYDDFNPDVYKAMTTLLDLYKKKNKHMATVMISRNPCINFGSHNQFLIHSIKDSIYNKTISINTRILKTMNADFDGDQVNVYRIMGAYIKDIDYRLNPIVNHYIDGRTGYVNKAMLPAKDEVAVINEIFSLPDRVPLANSGLIDEAKRHLLKMREESKPNEKTASIASMCEIYE